MRILLLCSTLGLFLGGCSRFMAASPVCVRSETRMGPGLADQTDASAAPLLYMHKTCISAGERT